MKSEQLRTIFKASSLPHFLATCFLVIYCLCFKSFSGLKSVNNARRESSEGNLYMFTKAGLCLWIQALSVLPRDRLAFSCPALVGD